MHEYTEHLTTAFLGMEEDLKQEFETRIAPAEIRVPALKALELTSWIEPIPQDPFPVAGMQRINIEPPTLTVPNLE